MAKFIVVQPGDRIDTLADRALGDPYQYPKLLEKNPTLDVWNPIPGTRVELPE
jgi:hypothetical protein